MNRVRALRILCLAPPGPARDELAALLTLQGHPVIAAWDVDLEQALARRPEVALVHLADDDVAALALARQLRGRLPGLMMVGLVVQPDRATRLRCLNAGIDDLCALPLDPLELRARLRAAVASAELAELEQALLLREDRAATLSAIRGGAIHDLCNAAVQLQCASADLEEAGADVEPLQQFAARLGKGLRALGASLREEQAAQEPEPLRVAEEVRRTLAQLVDAGPLRRAELVIRTPPAEVVVAVPRAHLEQLVANLTSAALQALADVPADERTIDFDVELRATGVALRATAVRPWLNGASPRPRSAPRALGLGLRALQALASACGGRCELERDPARGRATLVVILPRAIAADALQRPLAEPA